ncbi:MAG TPA: sensor histidine kinase [Bryobacterales bacterium]|nr:sensor histidine kinase [Bryobacterales bacterium]
MPTIAFGEQLAYHGRRTRHVAVLRLFLAAAYLVSEILANSNAVSWTKWTATGAFLVYAILLAIPRVQERGRNRLLAQFIDLIAIVVLVYLSDSGQVMLPLLMFYFVLAEAALLHGAREVLLVAVVGLGFYGPWVARGNASGFELSSGSFLLLLLAGGGVAYYFSLQRYQKEQRVSTALRQAEGQSEAEMVQAVEMALRQLANWLNCSGAILAIWDEELDYNVICQYPSRRQEGEDAPTRFEDSHEWACFQGARLDFYSNDLSEVDRLGNRVSRDFDLHPYIIQKFEMYNCVGHGLADGDRVMGRLILFNSVSEVRRSHWKQLQTFGLYFRGLLRHLLRLKKTEFEAYGFESERIAHDLHDGPLQSMISFEMRLEVIRRLIYRNADAAADELLALQQFSRKLVAEMRTFVHRMRPIETDSSSLMAATRRLVEAFQKESGIAVTFMNGQTGDLPLSPKTSTEVLQVAREALNNINKHAQATHVLFSVEQKNGRLYVSVHDNGRGFRFGGRYSLEELELMRLGPQSIKQRVRAMGGDLSLESQPGQGANVRVSVPMEG